MAQKEERFVVAYKEGSDFTGNGVCMILVDREPGVGYLTWKSDTERG